MHQVLLSREAESRWFEHRRRRVLRAWSQLRARRPELAEAFYVHEVTLEELEAEIGLPVGPTRSEFAARFTHSATSASPAAEAPWPRPLPPDAPPARPRLLWGRESAGRRERRKRALAAARAQRSDVFYQLRLEEIGHIRLSHHELAALEAELGLPSPAPAENF